MPKFLFSTGNKKGVGLEISLKAFLNAKHTDVKIIMCDKNELHTHSKFLNFECEKLNFIDNLNEDLDKGLYFYTEGSSYDWFVKAVEYCSEHPENSALITGPLSKDQFLDSNVKGHTSYLEHKFNGSELFMTFLGSIYNCLLLTDHVPLLEIDVTKISNRLSKAVSHLKNIRQMLNLEKPIGLLGFNPHAGENGLLGNEEIDIHNEFTNDSEIIGPLPADGFFSQKDYEKYSFLIANYHDQGLIAFKLLNGFNACQTTLGLPFIRTSVNHGTAENLYLQNLADETSMIFAFKTAKKLLEGKNQDDRF